MQKGMILMAVLMKNNFGNDSVALGVALPPPPRPRPLRSRPPSLTWNLGLGLPVLISSELRTNSGVLLLLLFWGGGQQLYCLVEIPLMGSSDCFPRGNTAVTDSRYPTYRACRVFQCFHNPPHGLQDL